MARKTALTVNNVPLELNPFVEGYVYHIAAGVLNSLKDTEPIRQLELDVDSDGQVNITLNGTAVPCNVFVMEIIRNTLAGMVSDLKGVTEPMRTLGLKIAQ